MMKSIGNLHFNQKQKKYCFERLTLIKRKLWNNLIMFIVELEEKDEAHAKSSEDTTSIGSNSVCYILFIIIC